MCPARWLAHATSSNSMRMDATPIASVRGAPKTIRVNNGLISKSLDRCGFENGVMLDFSQRGKPTDNPALSLSKGPSSRDSMAGFVMSD